MSNAFYHWWHNKNYIGQTITPKHTWQLCVLLSNATLGSCCFLQVPNMLSRKAVSHSFIQKNTKHTVLASVPVFFFFVCLFVFTLIGQYVWNLGGVSLCLITLHNCHWQAAWFYSLGWKEFWIYLSFTPHAVLFQPLVVLYLVPHISKIICFNKFLKCK